jgi:amidohydrolase
MHACGHDGHTAVLLTVARILQANRQNLAGKVKLVFQPAEEGMGGAEKMIEDGVLENPKVDLTLALHLWNECPLGWIGISNGPSMAGGEVFRIVIHGKGGHGAVPQFAIDPILASAQVVNSLQSIVSRNVNPLKTAVISVCSIHGGDAFNVIPQSVELKGTIRTFEASVRKLVLRRFDETVRSVVEGMGCRAEIEIKQIAPAVINHTPTALVVQKVAQRMFPDAVVDTSDYITMGSEDMAYFMEKVPGCFIFIGSANFEKGLDAAHHHPRFDFDETSLVHAGALMSGVISELLHP